ncbi:MAG: hypothetical protein LBI54_01290 [Lachnospiraceae bacterium]|jgi:hypothetical protein|nr:hypothetical protein [Lachnospiraceae bacterium]
MTGTKDKPQSALSRLTNASEQGIKLYIDGESATPDEIAFRCVNEKRAVYMADYVLDERGELTEIRYDKVVNE